MTVNQLLDLISNLPLEKRNHPTVISIKQGLLSLKFSDENKGFGGIIQLDNFQEIIEVLNKLGITSPK